MKAIKVILLALTTFTFSTVACASKEEILIDGKVYKVKEQLKSKHDIEADERWHQKTKGLFYFPKYMTMYESEREQDLNGIVEKAGLDEHQKKLAAQSAVLGFGLSKGLSVTGFDVANLAVSFMFSGVEDQAVRMSAEDAHRGVIDGSITVARWIPGRRPVEALSLGYPEIKPLLTKDCLFSEANEGELRKGQDAYAVIRGKCKTNSARPGVVARNAKKLPAWMNGEGDGSVVTYIFNAMGRSQDEMRAFGATVRQSLSKDWYVMQAETLTNQKTGQPEKMYLISKDGVMKAYPLPPAPVFK